MVREGEREYGHMLHTILCYRNVLKASRSLGFLFPSPSVGRVTPVPYNSAALPWLPHGWSWLCDLNRSTKPCIPPTQSRQAPDTMGCKESHSLPKNSDGKVIKKPTTSSCERSHIAFILLSIYWMFISFCNVFLCLPVSGLVFFITVLSLVLHPVCFYWGYHFTGQREKHCNPEPEQAQVVISCSIYSSRQAAQSNS